MGRRAVQCGTVDDSRPAMGDTYRPQHRYHEDPSSYSPRPWSTQKSKSAEPPPSAVSAYSSGGQVHQSDFAQSTLNLVTCVLGAGALGYPFCFKECGLLLATIIMLATLVATRISYQLLLYCAQLSGRKSYESIAEHALGKTGRQLVELCIAAMNLGALVAFLDILADVLSSVAGTIIPPGAEPSRHAYITGVTLLGALPVSLVVREPSLIANMSNAAVVFVMVFAVVVFCTAFGPSAAAALGVRWAALTHDSRVAAAAAAVKVPVLHMWNPQGVLVSLPVMAYGFTAHQYYMGIYTMLKAPTVRKMKLVTDAALLVCAGVYWTVGVGGYATFGDRTAGDIIRNFGGQRSLGFWGAYERALKLCYGMAVLGNIPLVIMPFSSILSPLLPGDEQLKQQTSNLAGACTVAGAKRCTTAALSGCGGSSSGAAQAHKARCSGSGSSGGRQPVSDGGSRCAGGDLACHLDTEALVLEAPTWHQHSQDLDRLLPNCIGSGSTSEGGGGSMHQQQQWQQPLLLRTQPGLGRPPDEQQQQGGYGQQQQRGVPLSIARRAGSPEEAPEHPHLTRDACRAAHMLTGPQHTLVVVLVLGLGLASAVWLPNVELIFGLTGSTASVLAAFIMPAVCFLRLYDMAPELSSGKRPSSTGGSGSGSAFWRLLQQAACCCCGCCGLGALFSPAGRSTRRMGGPRAPRHSSPGASKRLLHPGGNGSNSSWGNGELSGGGGGGNSSPSKVWGPVLVVPELRAQWACRQRLAFALLAFGLISGLLCTDAILSSISEEKAVVQLAQSLVAHEAVVAQTSRAQQKAKEAAAAVDAVSSAAQQLGAVDTTTNQTLGSLTAAAAALNTIATSQDGAGSANGQGPNSKPQLPSMWDLKGRIEQHKQKVAEDTVLRNVEAALSTAAADISSTTASVTAVIIKLDTSIAQIKADAAAAAAAVAAPVHQLTDITSSSSGSSGSNVPADATAPAGGDSAVRAPDGSVVQSAAAGGSDSSAIVPHGAGTAAAAGGDHPPEQQQQQPAGVMPPALVLPIAGAAGTGGKAGSGTSSDAYARANEMARELGQALGAFGKGAAGANLTLTAGRSLEQVRDSAISALTALNVTADVLRQVRGAVAAARHAQAGDSTIKDLAVTAMQRALNATAASALAMRITREALGTAATEETSELLTALTRVAQDLEKSDSSSSGGAGGGHKRPSITVSSDEPASAGAAGKVGGAPPAAGVQAAVGSSGAVHVATPAAGAAAGMAAVQADAAKLPSAGGASEVNAVGAAPGAEAQVDSSSGSSSSGSNSEAGDSSGGVAAAPAAKTPTLAEHEAAAGAAANAAAHAESESNTPAPPQQQRDGDAATVQAGTSAEVRGEVAGTAAAPATAAGSGQTQHEQGGVQQQQPAADAAAANAAAHADSAAAAALPPGGAGAVTTGGAPGGISSSTTGGAAAGSASGGATAAPTSTTSSSGGSKASAASVLTASEASKIKGIISHLASAMSTGSAGTANTAGSGSAIAGQGGGSSGAAAANITQLAAAIHDAVTWTEQSRAAVLGLIVEDLGTTNPKVAQRVMGIVQEVGIAGSDADRQHEEQKEERQAVAAAAAALDAAAVTEAASKQQQQPQQGVAEVPAQQQMRQQAPPRPAQAPAAPDGAPAAVAGPVVAVTADGQLQQQQQQGGASGTEGPVVHAATPATAPADTAPGATVGVGDTGTGGSSSDGDPSHAAATADGAHPPGDAAAVPAKHVQEAVLEPGTAPAPMHKPLAAANQQLLLSGGAALDDSDRQGSHTHL